MVLCNLRSLLVVAIVLVNCITWTASRHHFTHNVSGHRSRHRRQGKGLYLMSSYVIPGGEGTGWGDWGSPSPCSRTCGGGVASQKRICLQFSPDGQPQCTGGDTKFFSCETQDCPPGSGDFRAEQCSYYNNVTYRGIRYKWKPYTRGPNPCELNCMPPGERFYYRHQAKVIDGTRCNDDSFDVCVNGTCQPVGCDMMLGSNAREDKCRRCRGNGKNCYTANGVLDTQDLIKGYNDMLLIPEGATTIVIMEVRPSNNYLALRAKNGTYYLNGDYHIDFPRSMMIAGALWTYERSQQGFAAPDKLRCLGPTTEPIYLALLLQSENVGIEYEYSLPSQRAPRVTQKYTWVAEEFTTCSATCGGGFQTRNVTCRTEMDLDVVDSALCDEGLKPVTNTTCNTDACPARWVTDEWGPCSKRCGDDGTQTRDIRCEKIIINGLSSIVSEKECFDLLGPKPEKFRECNVNTTCPTWFTGPWKPCDKLYGEGKQTRQVVCYQKNGRRIDVLEDSECSDEKPESEKSCIIHPVESTEWMTSEWFGCDNCLSTIRTRTVKCATLDRKLVDDKFCSHHTVPVLQESCDPDKLPPCEVQWYASQWSKCSTECGEGLQTRRVFCGMFMDNSVVEVEESRCTHLPKYNDTRPCTVPREKCPSQWYTAPWEPCDKECGTGEQWRRVLCMRGNELATDCDPTIVPDSTQNCNTGPCNKDYIIPLDSKTTPIIDEEECDYEEDYPEVGLDFITPILKSTTKDHMLSDSPAADLGSGMTSSDYFISTTYEDTFSDGSGSGDDTSSTMDYTDSESTSTDDLTTVTESSVKISMLDTEETYSAVSETGSTETAESTESTKDITEVTGSTETDASTQSTDINTVTTVETESTETSDTSSSESITDETGTTETTVSEATDYTDITDDTESSSVSISSESTGTDETTVKSTKATEDNTMSSSDKSESTRETTTTEPGFTASVTSENTESTETDESTVSENLSTSSIETGKTTESESESTTAKTSDESTKTSDESTKTSDESTKTSDESTKTSDESTTISEATEITGSKDASTSQIVVAMTESGSTITSVESSTTETSITEVSEKESTLSTELSETTSSDSTTSVTSDKSTTTAEPTTTEKSEEETTSSTGISEMTKSESSTMATSDESTTISESTETTDSKEASTSPTVVATTESSSTMNVTSDESTTTETTKVEESKKETTLSTEFSETTTFESTTVSTDGSTTTTESTITKDTEKETTLSTEVSETTTSESTTVSTDGSTTTTELTITKDTEKETTLSTEVGETTIPESTTTITSEESTTTTIPSETIPEATSTKESTEIESTTKPGVISSTTEAAETTETPSEISTVSELEVTESSTKEVSTTALPTTEKEETTVESTTAFISTKEAMGSSSEATTQSATEKLEKSTTTEGAESTTEFSTTTTIPEGTESTTATEVSPTTESSIETTEISTPTSAEATESTVTVSSEGTTTEESSIIVITTEKTSKIDWRTTLGLPHRPKCKPRKVKCSKTTYGCCPDLRTPAKGPFDKGCPRPQTCKESQFGCCPDGLSPALGPLNQGCPTTQCAETLFGCCLSDNKTAAEGNDQEGCPPPPPACESSTYGCCADGQSEASGPEKEGCPELTTEATTESETESETVSETVSETKAQTETQTEKEASSEGSTYSVEGSSTTSVYENCTTSEFGCCLDSETPATGPNGEGCPCHATQFGCCPDGVSTAKGVDFEGCVTSCNTSQHGCCPDGKTPAHGPDNEGCCLLYAFGCCPDNYKPADGPHLEGCGCQYARFGCCPDNATIANGPDNEGCGCQYTAHGCCPDRHTEAPGPNYEGCSCHTYQFGCCDDGVTVAKGPGKQGCHCRESQFGCCGDDKTPATGPEREGCDCASSEFGCCPDGHTEAKGHKFFGCSDIPENRQAACALPTDRGSCRNYTVYWYYDLEYGGCSRFWYGGCEGNGNRFTTKEECEDICVQPSPKDACKLPKVKGACMGYNVRWYYDYEREQCSQFIFGGCLGNANNFDSQELCQSQCQPTRTEDQCSLPIDRGSCAGNFGRWGFNDETRRCEQFIWGGCEGNANRFSSEAACIQRCDPPGTPKPQCMEEQVAGNCTDKEPVWSFSQTENRCVPFYYSGCGGNGNRFNTEQSCAQACPSAYVPDVCAMPAVTGDCADYRERWYFDTTEKSCRQFYYGGCGGNANNFATQMECENRCAEPKITTTVQPAEPPPNTDMCFMEKDAGGCDDMQTRWMYDYKMGRCVSFEYGGCGGNQNNFPTEQHCQYYCHSVQDICQLPMLEGPCNDSIMSWFYDPTSDSCSQFTYGGCEGNDNRFNNREDCERRCRTAPPTTTSGTPVVGPRFKEELPSECHTSTSLEPCERSGQVWYLDSMLGECVPHDNLESGNSCRNTGVFRTQETCERSCGAFRNINVCRYGLDPGPCQHFVSKYYFDANTGRCVEFAYGGCHGGPNRFSTIDECQQVCAPEIDPCTQDPEPGNCLARYVLWYYDRSRDECLQFIYGGCGGNENRFETREDCEGRCRQKPQVATTTTTTTTTTTLAPTTTTGQPIAEECRTPDSLVPCGANITVYYYDEASRSCLPGEIGGCMYANSFRTEEECERRCGAFAGINVCEARLDPGPCRASIPKFYWDPASGSCQPYGYGGCGGGANRFSSVDECKEICGNTGPAAACLQPVSTGSSECGTPSRRWHYSVPHADCLVFVYEGCAGTDNNFPSYEQCTELCKVSRHPDCRPYDDECLQLVCPYGMARERTPEGCTRCSCVEEIVDCEPMRAECEALRCAYGILRTRERNGCERCQCQPDPCLGKSCPVGENCVATRQRDPVTGESLYTATCEPRNDVLPDCDRFNDECSRLRCEYGVQRTRTVDGCERCTCVQVEIDCAPLKLDCDRLNCTYGMEKMVGKDGCERCRCTKHPCDTKSCDPGDRCVVSPYRDPITQEHRYSAECRTVNKTGYCPPASVGSTESSCVDECRDDADCRGVGKCCARGCSRRCIVPDASTLPPYYTTTHAPDIPQAPQVSHETEPEVSAEEGGKATLRCIFHGNPPPKITWRRGEITINSDVGRYRLLSNGALEIVSLYRNDSGVYICVAENELGTARQEINLVVKDPVESPAGIAGEQNTVLIGELGKRLVIRCLTYGYPTPSVSWHRGLYGSMVPYSSTLYEARDNALLIRRLTYETVGEYACQAYNGNGRPASWLVVVKAHQTDDASIDNPYILPRIRTPEEQIPIKVIEVTTQREFYPVTTTTTTTPEPDIEFNKPMFTVPVRTTLSAPYTSLTVGSELSLTCEVDGYPEPELYWAKDNKRIIPNDNIRISGTSLSRLTVSRVSLADAGTYECHARNEYSSHYSYVQIIVQSLSIPAKCTDSPFFANCNLIVRSKFCQHKYYSKFCCKSCLEAGQLSVQEVEMQADQPLVKRK